MQVTIHENKEDYSPAEAHLLAQAYQELEVKAQGGNLTLEETRIRVAYVRYKREENFKIAILPEKKTRAVKEPKDPNAPKASRTRTAKVKTVPIEDNIAKASKLLFKQNKGEFLTDEEMSFLTMMMADPNDL